MFRLDLKLAFESLPQFENCQENRFRFDFLRSVSRACEGERGGILTYSALRPYSAASVVGAPPSGKYFPMRGVTPFFFISSSQSG